MRSVVKDAVDQRSIVISSLGGEVATGVAVPIEAGKVTAGDLELDAVTGARPPGCTSTSLPVKSVLDDDEVTLFGAAAGDQRGERRSRR